MEAEGPDRAVKAYLFKNQLADQAFFDAIDAEAEALGRDVRKRCLEMPDPDPMAIFQHVYAERHPLLEEEREQFAAYLATFESEA